MSTAVVQIDRGSRGGAPTWLVLTVTGVLAAGLAACAAPPGLNADLGDPELRARLDADFPPGLSLEQVQARLDQERVPRRLRRVYSGPPVQLLARLFPVGGFWVDRQRDWQETPYVDAWFVFGSGGLERADTERKVVRLGHKEYLDPPFHTPEILPDRRRPVPADGRPAEGAHADQ